MAKGAFTDKMGYRVDVGTIVGFEEVWCTGCEKDIQCPSYIVVDLPNYGNMVVMTQIRWNSEDSDDWSIIDPNQAITVEPWKIGAI